MAQNLFEQNGGTYTRQGDYFLPDVKLPNQPEYEIGVWSQRRRQLSVILTPIQKYFVFVEYGE